MPLFGDLVTSVQNSINTNINALQSQGATQLSGLNAGSIITSSLTGMLSGNQNASQMLGSLVSNIPVVGGLLAQGLAGIQSTGFNSNQEWPDVKIVSTIKALLDNNNIRDWSMITDFLSQVDSGHTRIFQLYYLLNPLFAVKNYPNNINPRFVPFNPITQKINYNTEYTMAAISSLNTQNIIDPMLPNTVKKTIMQKVQDFVTTYPKSFYVFVATTILLVVYVVYNKWFKKSSYKAPYKPNRK